VVSGRPAFERFTRGRAWQVQPTVAPRFAGPAAVERARSCLGEDEYRFWSNNCEHFVQWCLTGHSRSAQVEAWQRRMRQCVDGMSALFGTRSRHALRTVIGAGLV
jgi:hypothetical protein